MTYSRLVTAATTIGASHQKQLLRFAGALAGGLLLGMGSQIFLLPGIDSIGGFTVLSVIVTGIAAWFATSSAPLSYFGVQTAIAYYLVNIQEFKCQTSLAIARDRLVGILLGLAMMWLTFDLLWSSPAAVQMKRALIGLIRSLAQFAREPVSMGDPAAPERCYALRASINAAFNRVRALADGVLFEFGPSRQQDLAWRDRIRVWQPQLRSLFLMRIASLHYRFQLPGFELPQAIQRWHSDYDNRSAALLEVMADWIEGAPRSGDYLRDSIEQPRIVLPRPPGEPPPNVASLVALVDEIDALTDSVAEDAAKNCRAPGVCISADLM